MIVKTVKLNWTNTRSKLILSSNKYGNNNILFLPIDNLIIIYFLPKLKHTRFYQWNRTYARDNTHPQILITRTPETTFPPRKKEYMRKCTLTDKANPPLSLYFLWIYFHFLLVSIIHLFIQPDFSFIFYALNNLPLWWILLIRPNNYRFPLY